VYLPDDEPQEPVDLVLANILAGPLVELAPKLTGLTKEAGVIVLSGLLDEQRAVIVEAYADIIFSDFITQQEWLCLQGERK
jgi:ribosomal protein L11 methyltransferase